MHEKRELQEFSPYSSMVLSSGNRVETNNTQQIIVSNNNSIVNHEQKDSATVMSAKKLPKKRKFDPSELEESDKPIVTENNYISSVVVMPPQSTAVDYSCFGTQKFQDVERRPSYDMPPIIKIEDRSDPNPLREPDTQRDDGNNLLIPGSEMNVVRRINGRTDIDLREWMEHRVLAKKDQVYLPGVIRQAGSSGEIWVEFDHNEGKMVVFTDVLCSGKFDVIGDASPSLGQITLGVRVCVRVTGSVEDHKTTPRVFVEGYVHKILKSPTRFVIKLLNHHNKEHMAKRADLRLLQPPWWEELEDAEETQPNGHIPLQLHHVVPTLQPVDSGGGYYR